MNAVTIVRHIAGYAVGISIFFMLIPWGLLLLSIHADPVIGVGIFEVSIVRTVVSALILTPGVVFMLWSNAALFLIGKGGPTDGLGIAISPRTRHLVIRGPYRYSRNPMVFGALSGYFAFAVYLDSAAALLTLAAFVPLIVAYLKATEEKRLERDFGEEYRAYRRRVSMIFPLPPRRD
ncbi:MAG: isoprenylcysteine carboxylmethyltransferase family protein [Spirochaetes bacterium]|nr:MAG: isoprenylcysteine carboxylmethyltransferase family protein [Spirochaetota bacterium]